LEAETTAHRCEQLRNELNAALQLSEEKSWTPPCQVVLYPNLRCYLHAVGAGAEATVGSSLVKPDCGRITSRRIDLRADVPNFERVSLPHELCHVLVADRFREHRAPLWYDEGLALLVDPDVKRQLHQRDLAEGWRRGTALRLAELLVIESYPEADRVGVFYGQCATLTHLLLQEGAPAQLHSLATALRTAGINDALQSTYGIAGIAELEAKWTARCQSPPRLPTASLLPMYPSGEPIGLARVVH
jgi:hypothetical protein